MLKSMGWKGQGAWLGGRGQGRAEPVNVIQEGQKAGDTGGLGTGGKKGDIFDEFRKAVANSDLKAKLTINSWTLTASRSKRTTV